MSSPHRVYSEACKREAVRLSDESGPGTDEVASDLGIGHSILITWRRCFWDDKAGVPKEIALRIGKNGLKPSMHP